MHWDCSGALICLAAPGCLYSEHRLADDGADTVFDPTLLGVWRRVDPDFGSDELLWIRQASSAGNDYVFEVKRQVNDGQPTQPVEGVRLISLEGVSFLDIPLQLQGSDGAPRTAYHIVRLRRTGDRFASG